MLIILTLLGLVISGCSINGNILSEFSSSPRTSVEFIPGTTPPAVNGGNQSAVPISGYCPEDATEVQIGAPLNQTLQCANGQFQGILNLATIPDGNYQITITPDKGETLTWPLVKDTIVPTVTSITIPTFANTGNLSSLPVSGSCSESNQDVTIQYGSTTIKVPCTSGAFSANLDLSELSDGIHTISITIKDSAGNISSTYAEAVTKDSSGPASAMLANLPTGASPIINLNIPISGTDISHYRYVLGPAATTDCGDPGAYSAEIPVSTNIADDISGFADGTIKLCVWPRDSAGNYLPIANVTPVTWVKDSTIALAVLSAYSPAGSPSNSTVNRTMNVGGVSIVSYKYVSVKDAFCSSADFSSAMETSVAVPITLSVGGGDGTYRVCVIGKNGLGNWQPTAGATASADLIIDTALPTLSMTSANSDPTNSNISVTVTFSEPVTEFTSSDVNLTNASLSGWSGGPAIFTFNLIPVGQGVVTASIDASAVKDLAENLNAATASLSRVFDSVQPSVSISSSAATQTNVSPIPFTITFSESVADFNSSDVVVTNGIVT